MFNLFTIVPTYCDRDGINGWRALPHPYTFQTELGAKAVAVLGQNGERYDDMTYPVVVPVGVSPFDRSAARLYASLPRKAAEGDAWDDIPF